MDMPRISWRPLTTGLVIGGALILIVASTVSYITANLAPTTEVRIGSGVYKLKVANDDDSLVKGLSGVKELKPNGGLLMMFLGDDKHPIWMKDMNVPIDIVWLDRDKKVVHIVRDARPEESTKVVHAPKKDARYVLEIASGSAAQSGIKVGDTASFDELKAGQWW